MKSGEQSGSREQGIYGKKDENDKSGEGKKVGVDLLGKNRTRDSICEFIAASRDKWSANC